MPCLPVRPRAASRWRMAASAFAPAKVNLTLHVTGRRPDGYHLLDSLVVFADVGDTVRVGLAPRAELVVTGPEAGSVPQGPENLAARAAAHFGASARIELEKRLPSAAGLGGGSSDAAAVLRALAALTGRGGARRAGPRRRPAGLRRRGAGADGGHRRAGDAAGAASAVLGRPRQSARAVEHGRGLWRITQSWSRADA